MVSKNTTNCLHRTEKMRVLEPVVLFYKKKNVQNSQRFYQ